MVITFLAVFTLEPHNTFVLNPILQKPTKKKTGKRHKIKLFIWTEVQMSLKFFEQVSALYTLILICEH